MSSPGASTPADASTLGTLTVTALNVGMKDEDSCKSSQGTKVAQLAEIIMEWLAGSGAAAVALNEIHSTIAEKVLRVLQQNAPAMKIQKATSYSNSLLWRAPQSSTYPSVLCLLSTDLPALPACPASCWCLDVLRDVACRPALPRAGASTPIELSPEGVTRTQCAQRALCKRTAVRTRTQFMLL